MEGWARSFPDGNGDLTWLWGLESELPIPLSRDKVGCGIPLDVLYSIYSIYIDTAQSRH